MTHPSYVYDMHTTKGAKNPNRMEQFITEGTKLENEDILIRNDEWVEAYRTIRTKTKQPKRKLDGLGEPKPKKKRRTNRFLENQLYKHGLNEFVTDGQGIIMDYNPKATKACVIQIELTDGRRVVIKEMKDNFSYGLDQWFCHKLKLQNTTGLSLPVVTDDFTAGLYLCDFRYCRDTRTLRKTEENIVYFITGVIDTSHGRFKRCLDHVDGTEEKVKRQILDILAFRMLMGVTDTNFTNIIVSTAGDLYTVDENFVGKKSAEIVGNCAPVRHIFKYISKHWKINSEEELVSLSSWPRDVETRSLMIQNVLKAGKEMDIPAHKLKVVEKNADLVWDVLRRCIVPTE